MPEVPIVHNLCGVVGAVAAGYLYFFFGAASYLWIIVLGGYGIAKLTTRHFRIRERLGWSFLFVLSGACLLQLQPWFLQGWNKAFHIEGPGGWIGKWVGERAFGGPLGEVGRAHCARNRLPCQVWSWRSASIRSTFSRTAGLA